MKLHHGLLLGMVWASGVHAAANPAPVDFTSQNMTYDPKTGEVTLVGAVNVTQGTLNLTCGSLVMSVDKKGDISTMTATSNVVFTRQSPNGTEVARGSKAVYQPAAGMLNLTGGVTLTRGGNTLTGEVLNYNLEAGQMNLSGGRTAVKGRFTPAATSGTTAP